MLLLMNSNMIKKKEYFNMKLNKTTFKQTEIGMIPEDWKVKEIGEVSEVVGGGTPSTKISEYWDGDIAWITPRDLSTFKFRYIKRGERNITKDGLENSSAKLLPKGTVLLTTRAPVGYLAIAEDEVTTNQGFRNLIPNDKTTSQFLFYLLKQNVDVLKSNAGGTTFGELSGSRLKELKFAFPSLPEQSAIAKILSDLDAKIELNQQMNKTLEEIGKAIFKHWFVDFEFPNEEGKPYKSSGGDMVFDEELGKEIPKGWYVGCLEEFGAFKNGINYLRNESGDTEFFIANVRDIANNKLLLKEHLDKIEINLKKAKEYLLHNRDILIARSASPGEVSLVLGDLENVIYSGFSIRYRLNNPENFLYFFLILQKLKENLSNYAVGTTLQSVNQETLRNMKLVLPTNEVLNKFNKIIGQILGKTYNNLIQNQTLSSIRDSLLPKLMSGKIRVPIE